ncbi:conjugal transfer protein TraX [Pseudomonas sp. 21LCFQ02]|nr:TraX family protein [Pseudomonas sp. 21LCFQ02]MCO8168619.1 conjugal transfer protein TraX [Pseudomonas sp. 21LCFQ02]MCO8169724.1 conjugal transfer protein TraX [Pseudomonas sp. 21LCFQ02]
MDLSNPPFLPKRDRALDLLKWLAMLSMLLDHLRYVGLALDVLYVPGRLAFAWFCLAIAANLARRSAAEIGPRVRWRYLGWMVAFSALSELPYRLFMPDAQTLNVMPTLLLGLLVAQGWRQRMVATRSMAFAAVLLGALLQQHLMFGFAGVMLPLVMLMVLQRPKWLALFPAVLCVIANAWQDMLAGIGWGDPLSIGALLVCLLAPLAGLALLGSKPGFKVWPMRRWAYAIYPAHFVLLWGIRQILE